MFSRFVLAAPIAAAAFLGTAAIAAPAAVCETTPAQLRTAAAAATADAATQRKALSLVTTGEHLCAADAKFEAKKKFAAAARALNVDLAALPAPTTTASAQ